MMWNCRFMLVKQGHATILTTTRSRSTTTTTATATTTTTTTTTTTATASTNRPRVAVVGGGIAGTLCSLVLKNRGIIPQILDASSTTTTATATTELASVSNDHRSRLLRGRATAIPFFRASKDNPPLTSVLKMLEMEGILTPMDAARMGMLGSNSQSFLPSAIVSATIQRNQKDDKPSSSSHHYGHLMDQGDFSGFVNHHTTDATTYRGDDHLCSKIWERAGMDVLQNTTILRANTVQGGGWQLQVQSIDPTKEQVSTTTTTTTKEDNHHYYDGLILATGGHSSWLAAQTVQSIAYEEERAAALTATANHSSEDAIAGETNGMMGSLTDRLYDLANSLQEIHNHNQHNKIPLYTLTVQFPPHATDDDGNDNGKEDMHPFDAVSVHGSPYIQFLSRESGSRHNNTWTAISQSSFVAHILQSQNGSTTHDIEVVLQDTMLAEMKRLLQTSQSASSSVLASSSSSSTIEILSGNLWDHAFSHATMNLKEDSIALQPWRLAICGDYLAHQERHMNPFEASSMSGLEAGERMATILLAGTQEA